MKNIFIIATDQPSRLWIDTITSKLVLDKEPNTLHNQHIYITSDEEIKEGVNQWYLDKFLNKPRNSGGAQYGEKQNIIILSTDPTLIKDGVQAIDDEFLEWFVKNPGCEFVETQKTQHVSYETNYNGRTTPLYKWVYKIIIPKEKQKQYLINMMQDDEELGLYEEPKQSTLEEAAEKYAKQQDENVNCDARESEITYHFENGAKWLQEKMYAEADNIMRFLDTEVELKLSDTKTIERIKWYFETYFEQFKKK